MKRYIGMKTYLHGPMDYAKTPKVQFRVGDLDLTQRRKRYPSRREEEDHAQMYLCGIAVYSRTHILILGECEMHKDERDV